MLEFEFKSAGSFSPEALAEMAHLPEAQRALTQAVIDFMEPYWGYDTGRLVESARTTSNLDTGQIVYDVPYASEMYYGIREDGSTFNYHLEKHPLAGPFPLERMAADHMDDIVAEVRRVAGDQ